jgi:hypothetical protein
MDGMQALFQILSIAGKAGSGMENVAVHVLIALPWELVED